MGKCIMCEVNPNQYWGGSFCENCRAIKNLGNVYGYDKILDILKKCCIRNEQQIQNKIDIQKKVLEKAVDTDQSYEKPTTRGKSIKKEHL